MDRIHATRPPDVVGTIHLNRHDEFANRSFYSVIRADTIESIREIDRRWGVNVLVRTVSGDEFACANDYQDVMRRWTAALEEPQT
jgi:hypothetical protein